MCIMAGTVANRPEDEAWEDTPWTACAECATFGPKIGQPKIHHETLWTPDEFTHIFEGSTFDQEYVNGAICGRSRWNDLRLEHRVFSKFMSGIQVQNQILRREQTTIRIMQLLGGSGFQMDLRCGIKVRWFSLPRCRNP
jgi:hypothetical protein